jgi:hypothetical protein
VFIYVSKEPYEDGQERGVYIHLGEPFNHDFYLAGRNSRPERVSSSVPPPANPYSANGVNATQRVGNGKFTVTFNSRISTGQSGAVRTAVSPGILDQPLGAYTLLSCNNEMKLGALDPASLAAADPAAVKAAIDSGLPEIASLMKPFFYQDNRHTLFVEPNVTEQTIEEWQEWVTRTPQPEPTWVTPDWWKEIPVRAEIPVPLNRPRPGDPPWSDPIDEVSVVRVTRDVDWLVNTATGLMFDGEMIGPGGRAEVAVLPSSEVTAALAGGGVAVNVQPGSSIGSGATAVIARAGAIGGAGLNLAPGGLNVVGATGLNATLVRNFDALNRARLATNQARMGAITP